MTIAQHSSKSDSWGTPVEIIEAARAALGGIDLDPASSEEWNQTVKAKNFITAAADGLRTNWETVGGCLPSVFLNPPGGTQERLPCGYMFNTRSLAGAFWAKLMHERVAGRLGHAIFVGFTLEILSTTQGKPHPSAMDFPFCVPSKRLKFVPKDGGQSHHPTHANAIIYVPGAVDVSTKFRVVFSQFGRCT